MLATAVARLWPGAARASSSLASSAGAAATTSLLGALNSVGSSVSPSMAGAAAAAPSHAAPQLSALARAFCTAPRQPPSNSSSDAAAGTPSASTPPSEAEPPSAPSSSSAEPAAADPAAAAAASKHASRRDVDAAAETVYPSSLDDNMMVQKNWFNALFSQLNVIQRTGMSAHMKGRQKEVFVAVEREFEALWERHIRDKGLQGVAHRGLMLCCLAVATHRVLRYETGDDELVKEVVRTNLGGVADGVMMKLHKGRLWVLMRLLAEDPYKQAVKMLPTLQGDMSSLVSSELAVGPEEATWTAAACSFHATLAAEDATELLPYFCCQYGMQYLEGFSQYGVRVGLEQSLGFGDECCCVRISKPWQARAAAEQAGGSGPQAPPAQAEQQQPKQQQ